MTDRQTNSKENMSVIEFVKYDGGMAPRELVEWLDVG